MNLEHDDRRDAELDYAWKWFEYHAGQRLTAFHFFLIIVGLIAVAFAQAIDKDIAPFGAVVALLGVLVSVGFWMLDVRNEELVRGGQHALEKLEERFEVQPAKESADRSGVSAALQGPIGRRFDVWLSRKGTADARKFRARLFTHRFWLRTIELATGFAFLAGALWAVLGFPGG